MKLRKMHWVGIIFGLAVAIANAGFFLYSKDFDLFLFILGISFGVILLPFIIGFVIEGKKEQEISEMFLEFSRNLSESVATGTPVSKSIINVGKKNYGELSPHIRKLSNQISLGVPVHKAMGIFADDVGNSVIKRAVALIKEAERAGGEIGFILDSVANSISEVEKLKKERKAAIFSLVVQGYIIFFIFIGIMLVMEFKILPLTAGVGDIGSLSGGASLSSLGEEQTGTSSIAVSPEELSRQFLYLLLTQGLFAGLTIGKLSEGSIKSGFKHSFILIIAAFLISTGAKAFLG